MKRMLDAKRQEVQSDLSRSMDYAQIAEKTAEERKRIREEKQRQARQQAIQVNGKIKVHSKTCLLRSNDVAVQTDRITEGSFKLIKRK